MRNVKNFAKTLISANSTSNKTQSLVLPTPRPSSATLVFCSDPDSTGKKRRIRPFPDAYHYFTLFLIQGQQKDPVARKMRLRRRRGDAGEADEDQKKVFFSPRNSLKESSLIEVFV